VENKTSKTGVVASFIFIGFTETPTNNVVDGKLSHHFLCSLSKRGFCHEYYVLE
jgi:hypothetical protein